MLWLKVLPQEQQELFSIMVKKPTKVEKSLPKTTTVEEVVKSKFPGKTITVTVEIPKDQTNPNVLLAICAGQANALMAEEITKYTKECNS